MFPIFTGKKISKIAKKPPLHIIREYQKEDIYILDDHTKYKGVYQTKYDFIVLCLLSSIGLGNVINFPKLVYLHGGSTFIVTYFFLSIAFGIPIFIIESGLSQFYSVAESNLFRIVPCFKGLGWSIHVLNIILFIPYSILIQWALHYFLYSLWMQAPWLNCHFSIPGISCKGIFNSSQSNSTNIEMSPIVMFFEFEVKGSRRVYDGSLYTFYNALHDVRWFQVLLIVAVWSLVAVFACLVLKMYFKVIYGILIVETLLLISITIRSLFLPGSITGISLYFNPDLIKLLQWSSFNGASTQVMFSLCLLKGIGTYSSLSSFKYDFLKASFFIILGDFSFSFISGIMIFSILGCLSTKLGVDLEKLFEEDITFIRVIETMVLNSGGTGWILIFMTMLIILGVSSIALSFTSLIISFSDYFPYYMKGSELRKMLLCILVCFMVCFTSLFFSLEGSVLYRAIFTAQISNVTNPVLILFEIIIIYFIYGKTRFNIEVKMMLGYSYNIIWGYFSVYFIPLVIIFVIVYSIYIDTIIEIPILAIILSKFITILSVLPLIITFILEFVKNYRSQVGCNIIKKGLKTPNFYGPYYKRNWLLSKYYQRKLVAVRKDPEFLQTVRETENLDEVLNVLQKIGFQKKMIEKKLNDKRLASLENKS